MGVELLLAIPPFFVMLLGVALLPLLPARIRSFAFLVFPAIVLAMVAGVSERALVTLSWLDFELTLLQVDQVRRVFGLIFAFLALVGGVYAFHLKDVRQQMAALLYGAGVFGVVFAGDWLTLWIFWEVMSVASVYLVWAARTPESSGAGLRYLLLHFLGGSLLLLGILFQVLETGSLAITTLSPEHWHAWIILAGVAVNAAVPPLHAWVADAYPRATVTGAIFMSAFTTKVALFVLLVVFPGWNILIGLGVFMALYGVVLTILANDIRRILSFHIISQVGYMVVGVGLGTELALNGATSHAINNIIYKSLLFMACGTILYATGRSKLTELGGLMGSMRWVFILYMVGAFSIAGAPFFAGFISKSMVISAAGYVHQDVAVWLLHVASVGTFLSVGLKLPYRTWFGESRGIEVKPIPLGMYLGMGTLAVVCVAFGVYPAFLYNHLPFDAIYRPYTIGHFVEVTHLLAFTFLGFWLLRDKLVPHAATVLDMDWFYRRPSRLVGAVLVDGVSRGFEAVEQAGIRFASFLARLARNPAPAIQKLFTGRDAGEEFDPDVGRPSMQVMVGLVLVSLVIVALVGMVLV